MKFDLEEETLFQIFLFLNASTLNKIFCVSKTFNKIANQDKLFERLCENEYCVKKLKKESNFKELYQKLYTKRFKFIGYGSQNGVSKLFGCELKMKLKKNKKF